MMRYETRVLWSECQHFNHLAMNPLKNLGLIESLMIDSFCFFMSNESFVGYLKSKRVLDCRRLLTVLIVPKWSSI